MAESKLDQLLPLGYEAVTLSGADVRAVREYIADLRRIEEMLHRDMDKQMELTQHQYARAVKAEQNARYWSDSAGLHAAAADHAEHGRLKAEQRLAEAFVAGAKWWEFTSTGATMWQADQTRAHDEAVRRYTTDTTQET